MERRGGDSHTNVRGGIKRIIQCRGKGKGCTEREGRVRGAPNARDQALRTAGARVPLGEPSGEANMVALNQCPAADRTDTSAA